MQCNGGIGVRSEQIIAPRKKCRIERFTFLSHFRIIRSLFLESAHLFLLNLHFLIAQVNLS